MPTSILVILATVILLYLGAKPMPSEQTGDLLLDHVKNAEYVSLVLTAPTLVLGLMVLGACYQPAIESWRAGEHRKNVHWLTLGVFVGFLGGCSANLYWAIPLSYSSIQDIQASYFYKVGAWFNIPLRQTLGTISAYCHLRSFLLTAKDTSKAVKRLHTTLLLSCLLGAILALTLPYILYM